MRDDLGHWEVQDQVAAARDMAKRVYVDRSRIGIWGWVSGDFLPFLDRLRMSLLEEQKEKNKERADWDDIELWRIHDL